MNIHLSFKEQLSKLIDENINKYPDAIDWIVSQMALIDIESKKTKAESIMEALIGDTEFFNNPIPPDHLHHCGDTDDQDGHQHWRLSIARWDLQSRI